MSDENKGAFHEITRSEIYINLTITACILIIGVILIAFGYNEAFFTSNNILYAIFNIITNFGDENLYIVFFCLFYFGIDKKFAKRLIIGFLISLHITDFLKNLFQDPRPLSNMGVDGPKADGYGFPSGHTSGSMSFYGYTYFSFLEEEKKRRIPIQIFAIFLMITVPLSRLIIGVHDLQDVVGGFIIGFLVITAYMYFEPKISEIFEKWSLNKKIWMGLAFSVGLWALSSMILYLLNSNLVDLKQSIQDLGVSCGILMGAAISFPIEEKYVKYDPNKLKLLYKILATLIALVITFGVYFGLSFLFNLAPSIYYITRALKYCIFIIISALGIPYLLNLIFKQK
ncbi:MAG: phosphatase PAP2 family protein [Promethearchaeota archaeon]